MKLLQGSIFNIFSIQDLIDKKLESSLWGNTGFSIFQGIKYYANCNRSGKIIIERLIPK
jgi:hypothetical protein